MDLLPRFPAKSVQLLRCGFAVSGLLLLTCITRVTAGVLVAPTVVFLDNHNRTSRMTVQNPTDKPQEVSVFFSFGLPESDSLGNVTVNLQDSAITDPHSAVEWVRAFPRKMVVAPNGQQVVRFNARPPKDLPIGEYWARVVIKSQDVQTSVAEPDKEGAITTRLNMIMQTAIMLKYRNGEMQTRLELKNTDIQYDNKAVTVTLDLTNSGNASYVGLLKSRLLDAADKVISHHLIHLAVYYDQRRRFTLPIVEGDFRQPYQVELEISNKGRTDIAPTDMIYGNDIFYSVELE
jgi:hypothetical protein